MTRRDLSRSQMLSQFFTRKDIASNLLKILRKILVTNGQSWDRMYFVESAAGEGVFLDMLPPRRSVGVEVDPVLLQRHPHYIPADLQRGGFLHLSATDLGLGKIPRSQIVVGFNPPFSVPKHSGRSYNVALEFVNHAAQIGDTIAMILCNTFRRPITQSKVDPRFHLVYDQDIPDDAFTLDGAPSKVTTVFQIWQAKYDSRGRPVLREADPFVNIVKGGEWGGDYRYVKSTDPQANVRICNWGSHATVGRLDGPKEVKQLVAANQMKVQERQRSGKPLKGFEPDNSHYYLVAANPTSTLQRFAQRKYLFEQLAKDRTMGQNPDLTVGDMVRIYISPLGTQYIQGNWIKPV
jgi:hypothetical protein